MALTTYRCPTCKALFHLDNRVAPLQPDLCPRCEVGHLQPVKKVTEQMRRDHERAPGAKKGAP